MKLQHAEAAQKDAERALALHQEATGPGVLSCWIGRTFLVLGYALQAQDKPDEARTAFRSAVENLESSLGKDNPETVEAVRSL
jgi:predicted negative regulator of RcsB-dependent stress response